MLLYMFEYARCIERTIVISKKCMSRTVVTTRKKIVAPPLSNIYIVVGGDCWCRVANLGQVNKVKQREKRSNEIRT